MKIPPKTKNKSKYNVYGESYGALLNSPGSAPMYRLNPLSKTLCLGVLVQFLLNTFKKYIKVKIRGHKSKNDRQCNGRNKNRSKGKQDRLDAIKNRTKIKNRLVSPTFLNRIKRGVGYFTWFKCSNKLYISFNANDYEMC